MTSTILPAAALSQDIQVFGEPQLHADGDLLVMAFAPDGSLLSIEEPGLLRRWNAVTGRQIQWQALSDMETLWAISPDGRWLASASDDLTFWDVSTYQVLGALAQDTWVTAVAFAADSAFAATGHDNGVVRYWNAATQRMARELRHHKRAISAVAFSGDGKILAAAGEEKTISLWDTVTGKLRGKLTGHTDRIPALVFHPGGEFLVSAGWDTTARVWNLRSLEPVILLNAHDAEVTALAISEDGKLLATADSSLIVRVWDFETKRILRELEGPQGEIRCLAFSPDGKTLSSSGDRMIHLWNTNTGQAIGRPGPRPLARTTVAVDVHGRVLASNGGGRAARVWDIATKKDLFGLEDQEVVHALAYSPDGRLLAGAAEKHIRLWEAASGKTVNVFTDFDEPPSTLTILAFSTDGTHLAVAGSSGLSVWILRVADGEPVLLIPDALDGCVVQTLAFHPDGKILAVGGIDWLATGGSNGAISLWDLEQRAEIDTFPDGTTCIAIHPSGKLLASTSLDQSVCVWNLESHEIQMELTGHDNAVSCVAYSPDGRWLASGGEDRTVRLWDNEGVEAAAVEVDSQITGLTFSADGRFLYTANANTTCSRINLASLLKNQ